MKLAHRLLIRFVILVSLLTIPAAYYAGYFLGHFKGYEEGSKNGFEAMRQNACYATDFELQYVWCKRGGDK